MFVAFDFDGTLVDSMPALRERATAFISEAYNKSYERADSWYMGTIGRSFRDQLEFLFKGDPMNDGVAEKFFKEQKKIYTDVKLHFGVVDTVNAINDLGWETVIISSTDTGLVSDVVNRLLPEFRGYVAGPKKKALKKLKPDWFVGDTVYDFIVSRHHVGGFVGVTHTSKLEDVKRLGGLVSDSIPDALDAIVLARSETETASQAPGEG